MVRICRNHSRSLDWERGYFRQLTGPPIGSDDHRRFSLDCFGESTLWLRKGILPLLTGKPDKVLRQGDRAAVLDFKFGAYRVSDPGEAVDGL
jgi:hypothetical protein